MRTQVSIIIGLLTVGFVLAPFQPPDRASAEVYVVGTAGL